MRLFTLCLVVSLSSPALAVVRLTPAEAKREPVNNVPGEIRGTYYARPSDRPLTKARVLGPKGPQLEQPEQGELDNCEVDSTATSAARFKPDKVAAMFTRRNGALRLDDQGRVGVRIFDRYRGRRTEHVVWVTDAFVYFKGKPLFTKIVKGVLWPALFEKALAIRFAQKGKIKGLNALNQGGTPAQIIEAITGEKSTTRDIEPTRAGAIEAWQFLKAALAKGEIVVAGTGDTKDLAPRLKQAVADGLVARTALRWKWKGQRMVADHDQAMLKLRVRNGVREVGIRNAWGSYVPIGNGRNQGRYWLPIEKFVLFFMTFTHSGTVQVGDS